MQALTRRLSDAAGAYRTVFRNPPLRRVQLAYGASITAEWGAVVALAVFAYELRGAAGVGIVGLVRMLPAAVATPSAAFLSGRAEIAIYALAGLLAIFSTLLRPTLAALLPSLATTPEELVAANGASLTTESLGTLAGPLLAGVIVAAADAGVVFR